MPELPPTFAAVASLLLIALVAALPGAGWAASAPPTTPAAEPASGRISVRPSPPPGELDAARVRAWHDGWRRETAALRRAAAALAAALGSAYEPGAGGPGARPALLPSCRALAREALALDRGRVLPAPEGVVDLYLRRSLGRFTEAATACLSDRPYAAAHALRQARGALAQAARALAPYGLEP